MMCDLQVMIPVRLELYPQSNFNLVWFMAKDGFNKLKNGKKKKKKKS